jgi:predicted metal-dependent HD superfamily phosphohydrolase
VHEAEKHRGMKERWKELCHRAGIRGIGRDWHERLVRAWDEPQRHYHNLEHLKECLAMLDQVTHLCDDPTAVEMALWFHDAVYDPKANDNEEQSARLALECLREGGCSEAFVAQVERLILATKSHVSDGVRDTAVMLDIDLSILGQPRERFSRYEEGIRREFAWVPDTTYREKRAAILEAFLARPAIYQTEWFRDRLDQQARSNLKWSIERLRAA